MRASIEECRAVYEKGYRIWSNLYKDAIEADACLPKSCFQIADLFQHHPSFPRDLKLQYRSPRSKSLCVTGHAVWETSQGSCDLPPMHEHYEFGISSAGSRTITFPSSVDAGDQILEYESWFNNKENHLFILIRAWGYILSARWAEIMPSATLIYTENAAKLVGEGSTEADSIIVDIGDADGDAARWWSAVLAPGQGWEASINFEGKDGHYSPWSTNSQAPSSFILSTSTSSSTTTLQNSNGIPIEQGASCSDALAYLSAYCTLHDVVDQSYAALSTTLLLPNAWEKHLNLPRPILTGRAKKTQSLSDMHIDTSWIYTHFNLDKLLVLGRNVWGMQSLLASLFYQPGVTCNTASSWLQSIYSILDPIKDTRVLAHIFMSRVPHLAFLWLGGIILNIHEKVLREGRSGMIPAELHAATWTGTLVSFLQEPVSEAGAVPSLSRADETRIYFLTKASDDFHIPTVQ